MTVAELIELLLKQNPEDFVVIDDPDRSGMSCPDVVGVRLETYERSLFRRVLIESV